MHGRVATWLVVATAFIGAQLQLCALAEAGPSRAVVGGSRVKYVAERGTDSVLVMSYDAGTKEFTITDSGVTSITASKGCHHPPSSPANEVICAALTKPISSYKISVKDGNDTVMAQPPFDGKVSAGSGDDLVTTGNGAQKISGGSGNDTIDAGAGPDKINGGGGTRYIDYVSYLSHAAPVTVTLNNREYDDGNATDLDPQTGRMDQISRNVEGVIGSPQGDDLTGRSTRQDYIDGAGGNDLIDGLAGSDLLSGGEGDDQITVADVPGGPFPGDTLEGDNGNDTITASIGIDLIEGGYGDDQLYGGESRDVMRAGPGFDLIDSGPGDDFVDATETPEPALLDQSIDCGGGNDTAIFDSADWPVFGNPASGCETRNLG